MAKHGWLLTIGLCALAQVAHAHINLDSPTRRGGDLKTGPCGGAARGTTPTVFSPGETVTVSWTETIDHPGHYRIAFDDDGEDFPEIDGFDDIKTALPFDLGSGAVVLADGIMDESGFGSSYEQEITLPDVECETCTLQLIQVMTDKPPYQSGTNDVYHECADLALRAGGGVAGTGAAGGSGGSGGADASGGSGGSAGTFGGAGSAGTLGSAGSAAPMAGSGGTPAMAGTTGSGGAGSGGTPAVAGTTGSAGTGGAPAAGPGVVTTPTPKDKSNGGCSALGAPDASAFTMALGLLALAARRRRSTTRRRSA